MRIRNQRWIACAAALVLVAGVVQAVEPGDAAPDFTLTDANGKQHTLADAKGKIVVLEWTNYDCPFVKKHYGTDAMQSLQRKYTGKGVVWYSIASSAPGKQGYYDAAAWRKRVANREASPTALLLDADGTVGRRFGAKTTPHMFVIDTNGKLVYAGAIDDKRGVNPKEVATAKNHVAPVLDKLLAGESVAPKGTRPYGCSVKY